jgi:hypothetical protein
MLGVSAQADGRLRILQRCREQLAQWLGVE